MRFVVLLLLLLSFFTTAQAGFGFGIGQATFDANQATDEGIDDTATVLSMLYQKSKRKTVSNFGLNIYLLDDNEGFSNNTTGGVMSSSASGGGLFGDYGFKFYPNEKMAFTIKAGYEVIIDANRGISNCTGCDSESIDIDGGPYAQIGTQFYFKNMSMYLRYNQYFDSEKGLESNFSIDFLWGS